MKKIATRVVVSLMFALSVLQALPAQSNNNDAPKIGFSLDAVKGERWQTDLDSFQARAQQLGVKTVWADARGDDDVQFRQVTEMIKAGIQVLVLLPHDTAKASRIVDAAKAAHVRVISYDRLTLNSDVDLYISFDPVEIGRMQAQYLINVAPTGNYVLIEGSPSDANAKVLHGAQMRILQQYVDQGKIKVIAESYAKDWKPEEAYLHMLDALNSSNGNITAVLAANDGLAGGAIQALQEHKLEGKVPVCGQDADLLAIVHILEGSQSMTVYKPISSEGAMAADEAVRLMKGGEIHEGRMAYNGKKNVPAIMLKGVTVTKDNIRATVIKDGFQKLDVINAALPKEKQLAN
jgi:D-xylose transport system substrate-binding protein